MNLRTLAARGLRFHWRSHLGVVLGAAVATAVLVGALAIGDSVRWSLRRTALLRIGRVDLAMVAPDRFFRDTLADVVARIIGDRPVAAVLQVRGVAAREDGTARVSQVQVLGVDQRFWWLAPAPPPPADSAADTCVVNRRTARALGVKAGDTILVRVAKPGALPLDAPLAGEADTSLAFRATIQTIAGDEEFGRFSLAATQVPPYNVFVPKAWLQKQLDMAGRANVLLVGNFPSRSVTFPDWLPYPLLALFRPNRLGIGEVGYSPLRLMPEKADETLRRAWGLADAELALTDVPARRAVDLRSRRVFLDPPVAEAAAKADPRAVGILTYFVNELRIGDRATPYSMVAAIGPLGASAAPAPPGTTGGQAETGRVTPSALDVLPPGMTDDETTINAWLAEDLGAKVGDTLDMAYYVLGPAGGLPAGQAGLATKSSRFRIRAVLPMDGPGADPTLMPDFPGLADAKNCRDWKPGIPVDLKKIRDKDQAYWETYRGTPKAFVTLAAGQRMWANRFGNLTAIRWPVSANGALVSQRLAALESAILDHLDPRSLGLYFRDARGQALAASGQGIDFGQLFLGLSGFLVAAALILTGLLFGFGAQERAEETGTLLALGYPPRRVRRLMLMEGGALALAGGLAGTAAGLIYTRLMLLALATVWQGAVGSSDLVFYAAPLTLVLGAAAGVAVALATIALTVRRQARAPARELLAAGADAEQRPWLPPTVRRWPGLAIAAAAGAAAILLVPTATSAHGEAAAGAFFGLGALLLITFLSLCHAALAAQAGAAAHRRFTLRALGVRAAARRRGRSLATISLIACGAFLVVAVGANRKDPLRGAQLRSSGTGGFALLGETSLPIRHDLAGADARKAYALPPDVQARIQVVPMRVHEGDDASCLNLNRPQQPRLLGVRPEALASRGAFTFAAAAEHPPDENPWMLLAGRAQADVVPAVADQTTIAWSLGKKVGDEVAYTDARGRAFRVRLVGALAGSILQGSLIVSEDAFVERFPSEGGYRMVLVDTPPEGAAQVAKVLSAQLSDVGLALTPAVDRLAELNSVENTYLDIFQALGGLGLLLGSVGLGVVVLRNVLERRAELAVLRAVGFRRRTVARLILYEHWGLLAMGLASGVLAALVAVLPALRSAGAPVHWLELAGTLGAVALGGLGWTGLATRMAMRGPLLEALRNE